MIPGSTLLWAGLAVVAGTGLFLMKYEVQAEERHLRRVQRDIVRTEQAIHVLKADWSYLNDPQRLRSQAERHLGLRPMRPNQIVMIQNIPMWDAPPAVREPHPAPVMPPVTHAPAPHAGPAPAAKPVAPGKSMLAGKVHAINDPEVASTRMRP